MFTLTSMTFLSSSTMHMVSPAYRLVHQPSLSMDLLHMSKSVTVYLWFGLLACCVGEIPRTQKPRWRYQSRVVKYKPHITIFYSSSSLCWNSICILGSKLSMVLSLAFIRNLDGFYFLYFVQEGSCVSHGQEFFSCHTLL